MTEDEAKGWSFSRGSTKNYFYINLQRHWMLGEIGCFRTLTHVWHYMTFWQLKRQQLLLTTQLQEMAWIWLFGNCWHYLLIEIVRKSYFSTWGWASPRNQRMTQSKTTGMNTRKDWFFLSTFYIWLIMRQFLNSDFDISTKRRRTWYKG